MIFKLPLPEREQFSVVGRQPTAWLDDLKARGNGRQPGTGNALLADRSAISCCGNRFRGGVRRSSTGCPVICVPRLRTCVDFCRATSSTCMRRLARRSREVTMPSVKQDTPKSDLTADCRRDSRAAGTYPGRPPIGPSGGRRAVARDQGQTRCAASLRRGQTTESTARSVKVEQRPISRTG